VAGGLVYGATSGGSEVRPRWAAFLDVTQSYRDGGGENLDANLLTLAESCLQAGCGLRAAPITNATLSEDVPFSREIELVGDLDSDDPANAGAVHQLAGNAVAEIREQIDFVEVDCSDVIGTFSAAASLLANSDDAPEELYIFSDMVSNCEPYRLPSADLSPTGMDALLLEIESAGLLPDLTGVTVRLIGGGQTRRQMPSDRVAALRAFYEEFLTRAGATLPANWWAARLDLSESEAGA
jgi:hypothetical protein